MKNEEKYGLTPFSDYNIQKVGELLENGECVDYAPKCYKPVYGPLGLIRVCTVCKNKNGYVTSSCETRVLGDE